jgi:uncharacterized membrane protein
MGTYEQSIAVAAPPSRLYAYLSDVDNLPEYMPRITQAHAVDDGEAVDVTAKIEPEGEEPQTVHGEAWLRVREEGRSLEWGSQGPNDYHGELEVTGAAGVAWVRVRVFTQRDDPVMIERNLAATLANIARLALAELPPG